MDNTLKQLVDELLILNFEINKLKKENQELKEVNRQQAENLKEEKPDSSKGGEINAHKIPNERTATPR